LRWHKAERRRQRVSWPTLHTTRHVMTTLAWGPELALSQPQMDATHEEFVALLAATEAALPDDDAILLAHWDTLVAHTEAHFAQEERWMAATGFEVDNCHSFQHRAVLSVMQACARRAHHEADFEPLRIAVGELALWFPQHAQMMDAALVEHMAAVGFDPANERAAASAEVAAPAMAGAGPITGFGGPRCG
jgi:hemerythrin